MNHRWPILIPAVLVAAWIILLGLRIAGVIALAWWIVWSPLLVAVGGGILVGLLVYWAFGDNHKDDL